MPPTAPGTLSIEQVRSLLAEILPAPPGIDLPTDFAGTVMVESGGDPNIVGDGGHAVGLLQVNDRFHPTEAMLIRSAMAGGDVRAQLRIAEKLIAETTREALEAASTLSVRGFPIGEADLAMLIDATWNKGPGEVQEWARSTSNAYIPGFHARAPVLLRWIARLGVPWAEEGAPAGMPLGVFALAVLAAIAIVAWWNRRGWGSA